MAGFDKRKVVCLTVALPHAMHYALRDFCARATDQEMRPVTQAEIARLAIFRLLKAKGVAIRFREADMRTNFNGLKTRPGAAASA